MECSLSSMPHMIASHHYNDVTMGTITSQITSLTIVYSTVYSDADQRKHQSSASLAFVRGIHRGPVNSPHKWPVTRKMFPFDDVIIITPQALLLIHVALSNYVSKMTPAGISDYIPLTYICVALISMNLEISMYVNLFHCLQIPQVNASTCIASTQ